VSDQIVIYQSPDGTTGIEVHLEAETVWLTEDQMAELFGRERSVITKHLRNVFREAELYKTAVRAKFAHTAPDGKKYQTQFYRLDAILSVGCRVNSKRGTQFRQWATNVLRDHLVQGFTVNQARIAEKGLSEMQQAIFELKQELKGRGGATDLFGSERGDALAAILGNIEQSMFCEPLYRTREEKAAHLLYFVIKDHPFLDGNKRIGSFLCAIWPKELMKYRDNGELITRHLNAIK